MQKKNTIEFIKYNLKPLTVTTNSLYLREIKFSSPCIANCSNIPQTREILPEYGEDENEARHA